MLCFRRQQGRTCSLLALLVLTSLVSFSFIIYFYAHLHVLPDGRIIVHSHAVPHSPKKGTSHHHTNLELQVLDQQSTIRVVLYAIALLIFAVFISTLFTLTFDHFFAQPFYILFTRRGPPALA